MHLALDTKLFSQHSCPLICHVAVRKAGASGREEPGGWREKDSLQGTTFSIHLTLLISDWWGPQECGVLQNTYSITSQNLDLHGKCAFKKQLNQDDHRMIHNCVLRRKYQNHKIIWRSRTKITHKLRSNYQCLRIFLSFFFSANLYFVKENLPSPPREYTIIIQERPRFYTE